MPVEAPDELIELVSRLQLATAEQVDEAYPLAQRLAGELPLFTSVWVDALQQAGRLTRFQAAEINAGRGDALKVGPYVLVCRLNSLGYSESYLAKRLKTEGADSVAGQEDFRLLVADVGPRAAALLPQFELLVQSQRAIHDDVLVPIDAVGVDGERIWLACSATGHFGSRTAAEWLIHRGRFSPAATLELARQMAAAISSLEKLGLVHGDVSARITIVDADGHVRLLWPGVRGIIRPAEGFSYTDLPCECYDYLAPERVADGLPPNCAADRFACAALWWHLLAGRTPLAGGNSITKLQAGQTQRIMDVKRFSPEAAPELVQIISACLSRDLAERPASFAKIVAAIGPATRQGVLAIREYCAFAAEDRRHQPAMNTWPLADRVKKSTPWIATAAAALVVLAVLAWPVWRGHVSVPIQSWLAWGNKTGKAINSLDSHETSKPQQDEFEARTKHVDQPSAGDGGFVQQAAHLQSAPKDLVITADSPADPNRWPLEAGQTVRGAAGKPARVSIPAIGWQIHVEDVHFENLNFEAATGNSPESSDGKSPECPLVELHCQRATFEGCGFKAEVLDHDVKDPVRPQPLAAIRWLGGGAKRVGALRTAGRLEIAHCTFDRVAAAIDWRGSGPMLVECDDSCVTNAGAFLRASRDPHGDELISIRVNRFTLRGGSALLTLPCPKVGEESAAIAIQAIDSVFAAESSAGLIVMQGVVSPARRMKAIVWTGQGSILCDGMSVALWRPERGSFVDIGDELESIAGLARGSVEFSGLQSGGAAASKVIRWTGPLQSSQPPGYRGEQR